MMAQGAVQARKPAPHRRRTGGNNGRGTTQRNPSVKAGDDEDPGTRSAVVRLVVGTDGSDVSVESARHGVSLYPTASDIVVISVAEPPVFAASTLAGGAVAAAHVFEEAVEYLRQSAHEAVEKTVDALATQVPVDKQVAIGPAGQAICQLAEDVAADVVVIGSRGHGAIRRALLGSVSFYVVQHAPCPVTVVRAATADER
jgi:nucleotide-binding universal stress UspA family protein